MISGPLNNEGQVLRLTILEMNETHPARVRCQVTCLNQQGVSTYNPAMAVIVTSQEEFIPVYEARDRFYYSWDGLHFEVRTGNVSYCEAQNNNTMEYEYLITSNSSKIDCSVVICGVKAFHDWPPHTCWGQSYGIIRSEMDTHQAPTNPSSDEAVYTTVTVTDTSSFPPGFKGPAAGSLAYTLIFTIIAIIILVMITLLLTVGFLRLRYRSHSRISPQCVQTVEQSLVIKVEQPVAIKSVAVREKETSFNEKSDSNRSSIQAQLQEKLPDTISSRSKTL